MAVAAAEEEEGVMVWDEWDHFSPLKFQKSRTSAVDDGPLEQIQLPFQALFYQGANERERERENTDIILILSNIRCNIPVLY